MSDDLMLMLENGQLEGIDNQYRFILKKRSSTHSHLDGNLKYKYNKSISDPICQVTRTITIHIKGASEMLGRLKMPICILIITLIAGAIGYLFTGQKLEQQRRLFLKQRLTKLDNQLRELGVQVCIIQTSKSSPSIKHGHMFALLDFWETDYDKTSKNLEKIKDTINEYVKLRNNERQVGAIRYLNKDGFDLEEVLKGQIKTELDEKDFEQNEAIKEYTAELTNKLWAAYEAFQLSRKDLRFKIIPQVTIDDTTEQVKAEEKYFYVRFNNITNIELRKEIRKVYKRLSNFDLARGDKIYFDNYPRENYDLINRMTKYAGVSPLSDQVILIDKL
ncbi:MAG: hypothetical protein K8T10_02055 [Candidatus Eremiobacteraeota bacterium]|nr:hypothetical protein [Candidatus Eremiobacteraeota bacterium]